jgi:hypothetical protein
MKTSEKLQGKKPREKSSAANGSSPAGVKQKQGDWQSGKREFEGAKRELGRISGAK